MRLGQILNNLISNAIKFTQGGTVEISVSDKKGLEIQVKDTGIGMSASQLEGIFDPFTQADKSISRRFGGTGLGLAIIKKINIKLLTKFPTVGVTNVNYERIIR